MVLPLQKHKFTANISMVICKIVGKLTVARKIWIQSMLLEIGKIIQAIQQFETV